MYDQISRAELELRKPEYKTPLPVYPASKVILHHGGSRTPRTELEEYQQWRGYQAYHMDVRGWSDIAYNKGVGPVTGNTYAGRGFTRQGGATGSPHDAQSVSICAIGDFHNGPASDELITGIVKCVRRGIRNGNLAPQDQIDIDAHRNFSSTSCPGDSLYGHIDEIYDLVMAPFDLDDELDDIDVTEPPLEVEERLDLLEARVTELEHG